MAAEPFAPPQRLDDDSGSDPRKACGHGRPRRARTSPTREPGTFLQDHRRSDTGPDTQAGDIPYVRPHRAESASTSSGRPRTCSCGQHHQMTPARSKIPDQSRSYWHTPSVLYLIDPAEPKNPEALQGGIKYTPWNRPLQDQRRIPDSPDECPGQRPQSARTASLTPAALSNLQTQRFTPKGEVQGRWVGHLPHPRNVTAVGS